MKCILQYIYCSHVLEAMYTYDYNLCQVVCGCIWLKACTEVRPKTFDLLVLISADSSQMDPTKIKNQCFHFIFLMPPDSGHIFGTCRPTEIPHLSKFGVFQKETIQTILKKFWPGIDSQIIKEARRGYMYFNSNQIGLVPGVKVCTLPSNLFFIYYYFWPTQHFESQTQNVKRPP